MSNKYKLKEHNFNIELAEIVGIEEACYFGKKI